MPGPTPRVQIPASDQFHVRAGVYQIPTSGHAIPYYITTMSLREAADNLRLVSEIPGDEDIDWEIKELYQRQIDWGRVEHEIVPYLKTPGHPQFFNALTVALLPFHDGRRLDSIEHPSLVAPPLKNPEDFADQGQLAVGPIHLGFYGPWNGPGDVSAELGQIIWNKEQVVCVAIDGQHRLAAIKELIRSVKAGREFLNTTRVPVILIVLSPSLGFKATPSYVDTLSILRRLFIDLNKNAKKPSRARQILLDDQDPQSRCVQRLLGTSLGGSMEGLEAGCPERLPLALVDWHSEQARFDSGPYITTVLGLDWLVEKVVRIGSPVRDMTDYDRIEKYIRRLRVQLQLPQGALKGPLERLKSAEEAGQPFSYLEQDLAAVETAFGDTWAPALSHIMTQLKPYASLIALRSERQWLDSVEFSHWYSLQSASKSSQSHHAKVELNTFEQSLRNRPDQPVNPDSWEALLNEVLDLKKSWGLAFSVAFQRALFLAFDKFARMDVKELSDNANAPSEETNEPDFSELGDEADLEDDDAIDILDEETGTPETAPSQLSMSFNQIVESAKLFIEAMNELIDSEPEMLQLSFSFSAEADERRHRLWLGSFLKDGLKDAAIDFAQQAAKRASDWLLLGVQFYHLVQMDPKYRGLSIEQVERRLVKQAAPKLEKRCKGTLERLKGDRGPAARIARMDDSPNVAARQQAEFIVRARYWWQLALQATEA